MFHRWIFVVIFGICLKVYVCENYHVSNQTYNPKWSLELFIKDSYKCFCQPFKHDGYREESSKIFMEVYGRLSNRMLIYSLLLSVKREYGFKTFLRSNILENLQYYFQKVDQIQPAEDLCFEDHPWEPYTSSIESIFEDPSLQKGRAFDYMNGARLLGNNINRILGWGKTMEKHLDEIRHAFTLKPKFLEIGDKKLEKIKEIFLSSQKKKRKSLELFFVGVHVRATDSLRDIVKKYQLPELRPSYYLSAMDLFVEKFPKKKFNVIFVLISDDLRWTTHHLFHRAANTFNVFLGGTGNPDARDAIGYDLAVMSRMNYTIHSYGTFSFLSGFLSGGKKIIPSMVLYRSPNKKHPLDVELSPFAQSDEGLMYRTKSEEMESGYSKMYN